MPLKVNNFHEDDISLLQRQKKLKDDCFKSLDLPKIDELDMTTTMERIKEYLQKNQGVSGMPLGCIIRPL